MISDNYVTGDNIYLRELQNFFFEVLGMMSITHYGAIGDGRRDNYGPLQVAIDDAHRRGCSFLYVPYGRFIYTGELINIGDLIFIGNPHSHIVNIRTGEEIEIKQFGFYKVDAGDAYYTKAECDDRYLSLDGGTLKYKLGVGENTTTLGINSFAQGDNAAANGDYSHAEGQNTTANGDCSHAEGKNTTTSSLGAHAEGTHTTASKSSAHAEGEYTTASGKASHAEGSYSKASGDYAHAGGENCTASGARSVAINYQTTASAANSLAIGYGTIAQGMMQSVSGLFNIAQGSSVLPSPTDYVHIVGNGLGNDNRSNCHTLDWLGNAWFAGDVYVGSMYGKNKDIGSKKLATTDDVANGTNALTATPANDRILAAATETINLVNVVATTGTTIALASSPTGSVIISGGATKIRVSASVEYEPETSGRVIVAIVKDDGGSGEILAQASHFATTDELSNPTSVNIEDRLLNITSGDKIYLRVSGAINDKIYGLDTYLSVEVVEKEA